MTPLAPLLLLLAVSSAPAQPGEVVESVVVHGNHTTPTADILAIVGAVAIGAALVVGQRGKTSQQEVQQQQAANPPAPATPTNPGGNCPKTC